MNRPVTGIAAATLLVACSSAPSPAPTAAGPAETATVAATTKPGPTAERSPDSLVYPVAEGEEWILFDAPANDPGEPEAHDALFLVRSDGTRLHRLVHQMTGSEVRATWSPDGSQVAYIQTRWPRDTGPDAGIWVVNADGSDPHRVFECTADDPPITELRICDYLDWGVDGAIYVGIQSNFTDLSSPPRTFEIWRIDPETDEGQAVLTREDEITAEQPRVSPDGTQLVYTRERISDGKWAIFTADTAGGPERQLTEWDMYAAYPDWSARGIIAFNTNDLRLRNEFPHRVCTVRFTDIRVPALTCIETHDPETPGVAVDAAHARWMPDGRGMTYSLLLGGEAYLALMDADGSDQRLVPGPVWGTFSELRPVAR